MEENNDPKYIKVRGARVHDPGTDYRGCRACTISEEQTAVEVYCVHGRE